MQRYLTKDHPDSLHFWNPGNIHLSFTTRGGAELEFALHYLRNKCASGEPLCDVYIIHLGFCSMVPKSGLPEDRRSGLKLKHYFTTVMEQLRDLADSFNFGLIMSGILASRHYPHLNSQKAAAKQRRYLNSILRKSSDLYCCLDLTHKQINKYSKDGIHLNSEGYFHLYDLWAMAIARYVK